MFLTSDDSSVTVPTSTRSCTPIVVSLRTSHRNAASMMPDRDTAALTTRALPTMMTMSSLNPVNASSGETVPASRDASSASIATTS